jgi:hypothetical protein
MNTPPAECYGRWEKACHLDPGVFHLPQMEIVCHLDFSGNQALDTQMEKPADGNAAIFPSGGNARVYWLCEAFPDGEISPSYYVGEGTEVPSPLRREASAPCWRVTDPENATCLLALDLGTQTGWALRSRDGSIVSGSESFRPGRFEGGGMRFLRFKRWLTEIKQSVDGIDAVYFEEVRRHAGVDAAHAYGGFLAHADRVVRAPRAFPTAACRSATIKKHATGKGNAGKDGDDGRHRRRWGLDPAGRQRGRCARPAGMGSGSGGGVMKIRPQRYRCPLGRLQPDVTNLEAVKETGWREQRILVVSDTDERLDFVERELVRRLGERLYGTGGRRHG